MSHFTPFPPRRRRPASRPLADLVVGCIGPVLGKFGFGEADVLMHWPEIVGAALAEHCHPLRLQWRSRRREAEPADPATLIVRVESASALQLQHMEAVIVDRVNTYLGWRCVGRLALRQGPLPMVRPRAARPQPVAPRAVAEAAQVVGDVADTGLREALTRLGARVMQPTRRDPPKI